MEKSIDGKLQTEKDKFCYLLESYLNRFYKMFPVDENILVEKFLPQEKITNTFTKIFEEFFVSHKEVLVIPLSGFSGVGKGFITEELFKLLNNLNNTEVSIEKVELDEFLNSTRGTEQRK